VIQVSVLKIEVQADQKLGQQNQYVLHTQNNKNKWKIKLIYVKKNGLSNDVESHVTEKCINKGVCYKFILSDSVGDGICCEDGEGYYRITYGGTELHYSLFSVMLSVMVANMNI